jgi:pyridoxal phosphate enzyme (YggS family)
MHMADAAAGLGEIRHRIATAATEAGRDLASVKLIVVSKTYGAPEILPVIEAGQRLFGENRVQEAKAKWPPLKAQFPDLELHLIGPLQSNKTKEAVQLFDAIHSIDRPKIAKAVADEMAKQGKELQLFIQVNTGEEPQKAGIMPSDAPGFVRHCIDELKLPILGLMCIPPAAAEPALHFAFLDKLRRELGLADLSMGMSADFETAIQFGATYIRVGSAIFGARN